MNPEARGVPIGSDDFLKNCLVEGDPAQQHRARKIRRRAILLSIILQSIALTALIVFPLLSKGDPIPPRIFIERPPFRLGSDHPKARPSEPTEHPSTQPCLFCKHSDQPGRPTYINHTDVDPGDPGLPTGPRGVLDGVINSIEPPPHAPAPPQIDDPHKPDAHRITIGHIDPAYLTTRVEPAYPHLAVQLRREGRVELHAIIAVDGSIQSLQIISGDPLFYQSALAAVSEWRYHPTILDGHAVEVDTHITVIYSLTH